MNVLSKGLARPTAVLLALVSAIVLSLTAQVRAVTFPGLEEIQSVAYVRDIDFGAAGLREADGVLGVIETASTNYYYTGKVGVTNFAGDDPYTVESGAIKFCLPGAPDCKLHPYGAIRKTGFFQRNVDYSRFLGSNVQYSYRVQGLTNNDWEARFISGSSNQQMIVGDAGLTGFPYAFTGGASVGPFWNRIDVFGLNVPGASNVCYAGHDERNTLNQQARFQPTTGTCSTSHTWYHEVAFKAHIPIAAKP